MRIAEEKKKAKELLAISKKKKNMMKRITVFTPTYNRGYILESLYVSLKKQTNQSFKWLIVDDGSTDNTEEIVRSWRNEGLIDLQYYKQVNAGKMAAHNKGVELCDTEFFLCIDSDDYLTNDAIATIPEATINGIKATRIITLVDGRIVHDTKQESEGDIDEKE